MSLDNILNQSGGSAETFSVDFSGAADFGPLEAGRYLATITDVEAGQSKSGNPKLHWTFTVSDGPRKGKYVHGHFLTSGNTRANKELLEAVGVGSSFSKGDVLGKSIVLVMGEPDGEWDDLVKVEPAPSGGSSLG